MPFGEENHTVRPKVPSMGKNAAFIDVVVFVFCCP
jgi:hypothetical protein